MPPFESGQGHEEAPPSAISRLAPVVIASMAELALDEQLAVSARRTGASGAARPAILSIANTGGLISPDGGARACLLG